MTAGMYRLRKPAGYRDRRQLDRALVDLATEYDGLVLDTFIADNLFYFGWTPFEIRRAASNLQARGKLVGKAGADGTLVLWPGQLELDVAA